MDRTYLVTRLPSARSRIAVAIAIAFTSQAAFAAPPAPTALPTGGNVVAGQAGIQQAGSAMTIRQATGQAIINWQSFNIGTSASVNFVQPGASSVALNRVLGSDPSSIYGSLTANGQVFLVNPSGILFGPGARVDVGGLVASTLSIRDSDFLSRNYRFTRDGAPGTVVNAGDLSGQYVALLAPEVRNEGVITARLGTIALAAGDAVTLGISGQRLVDVQVDKASIDTLVENRHLIRANEGTVILSAQSAYTLLGRAVNSGTIEANGISADGGTVRLLASTTVEHSGGISASGAANGSGGSAILLADLSNPASRTLVSGSISARGGSESGDGGFIETSAHRLSIADSTRVDTSSPNGRSGLWLLDPIDLTIAPNGDIAGTTISAALNGGSDVTLTTNAAAAVCNGVACAGPASPGANGDIHVNQEVSWTTAKTLTLSAWRDVNINSPITSTNATGKLALEYNQGDGGGTYRVYAPVTLAAGNNFSTKDGSAAVPDTYSVITSKAGLVGISGDLTAKYALGADIDASGADWVPLGTGDNAGTGFSGVLEGLRHAVTKLTTTTAAATYVGLFGTVDATGKVQNIGVETDAGGITGAQFVGVVAGKNYGTIGQTYSKGLITGAGAGTVLGIGGLVGWNEGTITEAYSAVKVNAAGGTQTTGNGTDGGIGGLVGVQAGGAPKIYASYATGQVDGGKDVGGLVGYHQVGSIQATYASGKVNNGTGDPATGGLVGTSNMMQAQIVDGYWDTTTSMQNDGIGTGSPPPILPGAPLTGYTTADMKKQASFAGGGTYNFNGYSLAGPPGNWVMYETATYPLLRPFLTPLFVYADNKTATYNATVAAGVTFTNTNSIAAPVGANLTGAVTFSGPATAAIDAGPYGLAPNVVEPTSYGGTGNSGLGPNDKTNQQGYLLIPVIGALAINPKALTVNTAGVSNTKIYDGSTTATGAALLASEANGAGATGDGISYVRDTVNLTGSGAYDFKDVATATKITFGGLALGGAGAGNYTLTAAADINGAIITKKALTADTAGVSNTKIYDGSTTAAGAALLASEAVGTGTTADGKAYTGDTVTLTGTGVYNFKDVATATQITFGGLAIGGASVGNYTLTGPVAINGATITQKALTVNTAGVSNTKVYDGSTTAAGAALLASEAVGTGTTSDGKAYTGDTVSLTGTGAYNFKDVATATQIAFGGLALGGASVGNYSLTGPVAINGATITKRALAITNPVVSDKVFDGATTATVTDPGTLSGFAGIETVGRAVNTATFDTAAVGTGKNVTVNYTLSNGTNGGLASNYSLADKVVTAAITAAVAPAPVPAPVPAPAPTPTPVIVPASATIPAAETVVRDTSPVETTSDDEVGTPLRTQNLALPKGTVIGKGSVIPSGGLVAITRQMTEGGSNGNRVSVNYTKPGEGLYQAYVVTGSDTEPRLLVADTVAPTLVTPGQSMKFTIPDTTFEHNRADATITLAADNSLPSWLTFDARAGTFAGTPPAGFTGPLDVKVSAKDNFGNAVETTITMQAGGTRRVAAETGAIGARAELRATATGGSRRESIGTGRIGGSAPGGGRLGTSGAGGRLGTSRHPGLE